MLAFFSAAVVTTDNELIELISGEYDDTNTTGEESPPSSEFTISK